MNLNRVIFILCLVLFGISEAQIKGVGYQFEGGPGTEFLFSRGRNNAIGYSSQGDALEDSLYFTLGVCGAGKFSPIHTKYLSYGYYGKLARGWLVNNTSKYYYHGHEVELKFLGNRFTFKQHQGYEEFFRYSIKINQLLRNVVI